NNLTFTLSDLAVSAIPDNGPLSAGTFKPVDYVSADGADVFNGPAPTGPYGTNFAVFKGLSANGDWSLYVMDDGPGDSGSFSGGWSLTVSTATTTGAAPTISDIVDQATTVNTPTAAIPFTINDTDTPIGNLTLAAGSSNP